MLPHQYVVALGEQIARAWGRTADDVILTPLPLFHFNAISVCVVGTLLVGGRASIARKFSVSRFWPEVQRTGATMLSMLGSLAIDRHEDHPDRVAPAAALRRHHAARHRSDLARAVQLRDVQRGSASRASLISMLPAGEANKPGAAGKRNAVDFDVRILDDDDVEAAVGEIGEIVCRPTGPNLMFAGYWRRPEETVAVLKNLWFHTGDLGRLDEDGFLFFVDRKKDYLRRRGENISSFEMERTYHGHPAIKDVAVHSVASDVGEDDVKVTAVLQPDVALTEAELCEWSVERVPYFAVPRYIEFRDDLPRNPVGRVLKCQLRDDGVTATTWTRGSPLHVRAALTASARNGAPATRLVAPSWRLDGPSCGARILVAFRLLERATYLNRARHRGSASTLLPSGCAMAPTQPPLRRRAGRQRRRSSGDDGRSITTFTAGPDTGAADVAGRGPHGRDRFAPGAADVVLGMPLGALTTSGCR
jgi:acyl-CoA synthetase (AMP-forming)/AMP-acid ligase II